VVALAGFWVRLLDFGRWGFWNDVAWVALATRVATPGQFWLSLSITPIGWASLLKLLSFLPGRPELTLRLLPMAFGLATLWAAHRTGRALGGGLAALLAVAAIAFDPFSVAYARTLKHYTAETCFALLAFLAAIRFARSRATRDLAALALVLGVGVLFANAQLFLAPPLLAAVLGGPLLGRDWPTAGRVALAGAAVAAWDAACFAVLIAPRMLPSLADTARPEAWNSRNRVRIEDVGPLIRLLEEKRAPDDHVLVYGRSRYVYAYYQRPTPVLVPTSFATVGFVPLLPDARVQAVDAATAAPVVDRAFAASRQVWFVGSRFQAGDARAIGERVAAHGKVVLTETRTSGLLMAVRRTGD
jgi:hypothetical protein